MSRFVCPVSSCQKELSRLQVMHFRAAHDCEPSEWVREQYGTEIEEKYSAGLGSYTIAAEYEWLSSDMVCEIIETRTQRDALRGKNNPMKREGIVKLFSGDTNPAKQQEVREKISSALTGHTLSSEAKQKISRKNTGNEIGAEHRKKIAEAASRRDTSYMKTEKYSNALSESLKGREPTYPTPYEVSELSHSVRSSWEEEIGTLLVENAVDYEYEKEFELSVGSYYADFVAGTVVIEVKGFANERSVSKATAFIEEYPDRDTSAYPRLQAGVERHPARLSRQIEVRGPHSHGCYGIGEMPAPNHKGRGTGGGSHGDDTDSDGASLAGPQPYEGDKREFPRCVAGSLRVRVGTEGLQSPESDGRIPAPEGAGGGQYTYVVVGDKIPCDVHIPWEDRTELLEVLNDE